MGPRDRAIDDGAGVAMRWQSARWLATRSRGMMRTTRVVLWATKSGDHGASLRNTHQAEIQRHGGPWRRISERRRLALHSRRHTPAAATRAISAPLMRSGIAAATAGGSAGRTSVR